MREGQVSPLIEVQANPGVDSEVHGASRPPICMAYPHEGFAGPKVELRVDGDCRVSGTVVRRLLPNGKHPSLAYFDDIVISPGLVSQHSLCFAPGVGARVHRKVAVGHLLIGWCLLGSWELSLLRPFCGRAGEHLCQGAKPHRCW
jgi:hypothetical protein